MVKAAVIIPARYHSTRLEGKPLATIGGKALIQHVYENAVRSKVVQEVIVATDDDRIYDFVKAFGGRVRMTAKEHTTGTDRVAEVARDVDASIIVNVQGDEPFVTAPMISEAVQPLIDESDLSMTGVGTGCIFLDHSSPIRAPARGFGFSSISASTATGRISC